MAGSVVHGNNLTELDQGRQDIFFIYELFNLQVVLVQDSLFYY